MRTLRNMAEMLTTDVTVQMLQKQLDQILTFLKPHAGLTDCVLRSYFTEDLWLKNIPFEIRQEMNTVEDVRSAIELYWEQFNNSFSTSRGLKSYCSYVKETHSHTLDNMPHLWITPDTLKKKLGNVVKLNKLEVEGFMSEKKQHEVLVFFFEGFFIEIFIFFNYMQYILIGD